MINKRRVSKPQPVIKKKSKLKKILRFIAKFFLILLIILVLLLLFIRSPWGQGIIVDKVTNYVSNKTHTKVEIEKLFITFSGDISVKGLYIEDQKGDTLIYTKSLEADIPLWSILKKNEINIDDVEVEELTANVIQKDSLSGFNYQFLIDAFVSDTTQTEEVEEDPNAEPYTFSLGTLALRKINLNYQDEVAGTFLKLKLQDLEVKGKKLDLDKSIYELKYVRLSQTSVSYQQTKPMVSEEQDTVPLPQLAIGEIELKNVSAVYDSQPDDLKAIVDLQDFFAEVPMINLQEQQVEISNLKLHNSLVDIKTGKPEEEVQEEPAADSSFWPDWEVEVSDVDFKDNKIAFRQAEEKTKAGEFNPLAFQLNSFNLLAEKLQLSKNETAVVNLDALSFEEAGGFSLKELSTQISLEPQSLQINNLNLATRKSNLNGSLSASFASLQDFMDRPEKGSFQISVPNFKVDAKEAYYFSPELRQNEEFKKIAAKNFYGKINTNGTLANLQLKDTKLNWGNKTSVVAYGNLKNVTDTDNLMFDIQQFSINSVKEDLLVFASEEDLGISLPETVKIEGELKGRLDRLSAKAQMTIPEGVVKVNGSFRNDNQLAFDTKLETIDLDLGKILQMPELGKISLSLESSGSGKDMNSLDATLDSQFTQLTYNDYDLSAIKLDGKIVNGTGDVNLDFKDKNVNLKLDSHIILDSVAPEVDFNAKMEGIDFYALGLSDKDIKAKVYVDGHFKGNSEDFTAQVNITDGVVVYDEKPYYLGDIAMDSQVTKDSTALTIDGSFLKTTLNSNASPDQIMKALQHHANHYFKETLHNDTIPHFVNLQMETTITESPIISDVFLDGVKEMDTIYFKVDFDEEKEDLKARVSLPRLVYQNNRLDSLQINIDSNSEEANFSAGFGNLEAGPLAINKTAISGSLTQDTLYLDFNSYAKGEKLYRVKSEMTGDDEKLVFRINPSELILNREPWEMPTSNQISISKKEIAFQDFVMSNANQEIKLSDDLGETEDHLGIALKNFELSTFMSYFNPEEYLASGTVNGDFKIINPLEDWGLVADMNIDNFEAVEIPLGKLELTANSVGLKKYDFNLGIQGENIDLKLDGDYVTQKSGPQLNVELDLNKLAMTVLQGFSGEALKESKGSMMANFKVDGPLDDINYKGEVNFKDAEFLVSMLNSKFSLNEDIIKVDNKGVYFNKFSISDAQSNDFTVNGEILTKDLTDPSFDLSIKANDFEALNSTIEDNELYYGKVVFDVDATVKGKLSFPKVKAKLTVDEKTDATYILPEAQVDIVERDGVVIFVNKENPDAILTRHNKDEVTAVISGIELNTELVIEPNSTFNIILDQRTGDNLQVVGDGNLFFNIERSGRTTLTGRYEISDGHYEMSLYNLVKRKFDIAPESSVSWNGDPMNADLDVKAIYDVKTSASGLMASQTSGESSSEQNKFKQRLPFMVYLNVKGELDKPILEFSLDMPEEERGAIGGAVYGRISQLNQQEDELNKQVFSLLVLNRFFPQSGTDGSEGGAAVVARDNLNQALSDQLNVFSDKLTGNTGIELNFGLESYTDYQGSSPESRTDLNISASKKLFNDRLVVSAGSEVGVQGEARPGEDNPVIGNVSVEYLLTESGRWRLRGFRKSEYENIIDGQVFVSGIALIFTREFNKFSELFAKEIKKEEAAQKQEKEEEEESSPKEEKKEKEKENTSADAIKEEEN
ncbi:translocation/assembly module TamB domain-containing protein [Mesonia sp. MT50]|uniref:Translocation/assembly module TamB domain-containing protein n=1 Tax=Mesonia profundi TaxID=3070998 RepID=A0ABU1A378_9FLAO|nr:translocation/assembly module TamB domain-containing protein [Mesonia profundi]MDQ7918074.1 translocation/assembly module TamB domain-containing protein [Mesonia profundi]